MGRMSNARYRMALVRMRARIADGLPLTHDDSSTVGDKYTICSWGMCSNDPEQWPDAGDHTFPVDFMDDGRVSAERQCDQLCPLQVTHPKARAWGCFYECRVFQPTCRTPTREVALKLYDERIHELGELPEVCACDDTGEIRDPVGGDKALPCPSCRRADYDAWRPSYDPWGTKEQP